MARFDTITFLSDYGHADEFVGVVKSVIRTISPATSVIDLTHDIAPHDVRSGGLTLARSVQYLAPGVVLAVVDPGVGTERRAVAVEVGEGQAYLVGPDNGLLAGAVAMVGGADRAVVLDNEDLHLPTPGGTFAGRDVFAPAAAHLCNGVDLLELGTEIETFTLAPGLMPVAHEVDGQLNAEVLWVDRYGNCQLNVDPEDLDGWGDRISARFGQRVRTAHRVGTYAELTAGTIGLVVDSYGLLSLSVDRGSAAAELDLRAGDPVVLDPLVDEAAGDGGGAVTFVELGERKR